MGVVILDAGPCLSFFAASKQRILINTLTPIGTLMVPEVVDAEIRNKKGREFAAATANWNKVTAAGRVQILPGAATDELADAVKVLDGTSFHERMKESKNLGELMVIAHGIVLRAQGNQVVLLIDDLDGQRKASRHGMQVLSTEKVLIEAARTGQVADRVQMRSIYEELRSKDNGLVAVEQTALLASATWPAKK